MKNKKRLKLNLPEQIDMNYYGQYKHGLTDKEIKEYLKRRAGKTRLGNLFKKFKKIAGINTMSVGKCEFCGEEFGLMYRSDVKRFSDVLFLGITTYFD